MYKIYRGKTLGGDKVRGYQTKKEMIYETLKQEIYDGIYGFNDKLVISHLAKRFSSSEIPVREALNQLNSDGLIDFKPHIGAVVNSLSEQDIKNIFQLRIELEGLATRLAIDYLTEEDLHELEEINEKSAKAIEEADYILFSQYNIDFHMKIYGKSGNNLLVKMIEDLWNNTKRYPSVFTSNQSYVQTSLEEHREICAALRASNRVEAELKMIEHKTRAAKQILKISHANSYQNVDKKTLAQVQSITILNQ